jgi:hypothetical protein
MLRQEPPHQVPPERRVRGTNTQAALNVLANPPALHFPPPVQLHHSIPTPQQPQPAPGPAGSAHPSVMSASQLVQQAVNTSIASLGAGLGNVASLSRALTNNAEASSSSSSRNVSINVTGTSAQSIAAQAAARTQDAVANAVNNALAQAQARAARRQSSGSSSRSASSAMAGVSTTADPSPAAIIAQRQLLTASPAPMGEATPSRPSATTSSMPNPAVTSSQQSSPSRPSAPSSSSLPNPNQAVIAPPLIPTISTAPAPAQPVPHPPVTLHPSAYTSATSTTSSVPMPQPSAPILPPPMPNQAAANANPLNQNQTPGQGSVSRVFKLQFDARRIVCCSQDSRIFGWDFANGDPEVEGASRFFVGP